MPQSPVLKFWQHHTLRFSARSWCPSPENRERISEVGMVVASSASTLSSLCNHSRFILVPLPPHLPILLCSFMLYLAQADSTWPLDKRVSFSPKLIGRDVLTGYIISWWMGSWFIWSQGYLRGDLLRVTKKAFSLFCLNIQKESISPFLDIGEETNCSGPSGHHVVITKGNHLENEADTWRAKRRGQKTPGTQWHSSPIASPHPRS